MHGAKINDVNVISPKELSEHFANDEDIVVQISFGTSNSCRSNSTKENINEQFKKLGIVNYITLTEADKVLNYIKKYNYFSQNNSIKKEDITPSFVVPSVLKSQLFDFFMQSIQENIIIVCLPGKTGDYTLLSSFENSHISHINIWNRPYGIDLNIFKNSSNKVKIITAIREPISQNLSAMYQHISGLVDSISFNLIDDISKYKGNDFLLNGGDAQQFFNDYINMILNDEILCELSIQKFIKSFNENILDITDYPFDQEKGYTVIEKGNLQVFVYQIEKLNNLKNELSKFIETPIDCLISDNIASDKWVGASYKKAQNEIKISKSYFNKCFDEHYVRHCYSKSDIEKFKIRWEKHIK